MEARMQNPAMVVPGAMQALLALAKSAEKAGDVPHVIHKMAHLRASQINGCSVCVHMHAAELRQAGEPAERIDTISAWRDAPFFTEAERAALALTEEVTVLAGRSDAVSEDVWLEARKHFDEESVAGLILSVAAVNVWNRLNAATRQVAGAWKG
ncbi:carboxymuconolactone decarboxylase family protein [Pseudonocardia sp. TRM90224]|uniref:carboxymuconolactone decarboxylase family protein n=1 Tax=Pseudonocardia sp. TRM90224 TaxID=2812678 RepID=UPI001E3E967E|nr:carboxymuconolactone decarboxylase family protein [Pseudonocardia sp. TRM90224]